MTGRLLMVLAAGLLLAADETPKKDLDNMQGTWDVVAAEQAGRKIPAEDLQKAKLQLIIKGEKFTYKEGDRDGATGTFKLDPAKKPPTIDVTGTDATTGKAEKTLGIYELKGDTMRVCFVPEGEARPKAFVTKEGTKSMIIEYKRVKK